MSTIIVIKEANTLILSTDSRMMAHDFSGVATDAQQKIFEVAPHTFIATSGRLMASEFQIARARDLAVELGTTDIQVIGAALAGQSLPCLALLAARLRQEPDEISQQAVCGESLLHGCVLVGRTAGAKLGYVFHTYRVQEGVVKCETDAYFDDRRKVKLTAGCPAHLFPEIQSRFQQNVANWIDPPELVATRYMEVLKRAAPLSGGPSQMVRLTAGGARWISRPPKAAIPLAATTAGTIAAAITMTAPTIIATASSGSVTRTITLQPSFGGLLTIVGSDGFATAFTPSAALWTQSSAPFASCGPNGFSANNATTGCTLDANGIDLGANSVIRAPGLPSSSPGAGSKKFWYDPADGNRVKFAP